MKNEREDESENEKENGEKPQIRQMNEHSMFRKNAFRTNYSFIFFESSESDRVFNYLHDSNSIFWCAGIVTEIFTPLLVLVLVYFCHLLDLFSSFLPVHDEPRGSCRSPLGSGCDLASAGLVSVLFAFLSQPLWSCCAL